MVEGNPIFNQLQALCSKPFGIDNTEIRQAENVSVLVRRGEFVSPDGSSNGEGVTIDVLCTSGLQPFIQAVSLVFSNCDNPRDPSIGNDGSVPLDARNLLSISPLDKFVIEPKLQKGMVAVIK